MQHRLFEGGVVSDVEAGTPQGSPISPLLANIALHTLDEAWATMGPQRPGMLVRYADDLVVLCPTHRRAEQAQQQVAAILAGLGLRLHPDKTSRPPHRWDRRLRLLGLPPHRKVESWKWPGRYYLNKWPSRRAMASVRAKVRQRTDRRRASLPLEYVVEDLNAVLRGWGAYFRFGNSARKFNAIDTYVHERLTLLAGAKYGISGRNWTSRFSRDWITRLGTYRLAGTVR